MVTQPIGNAGLVVDLTLDPQLFTLNAEAQDLTAAIKNSPVLATVLAGKVIPQSPQGLARLQPGPDRLAVSASSTAPAMGRFIFGTAANNILRGTIANDVIYGFGGDDTLYGGAGNDRFFGGLGSDVLFGEEGDDEIFGGTGDDVLDGGNGNDRLFGEGGSDILRGSRGNDLLDGGMDQDIADYSNLGQTIILKPQGGITKGGGFGQDLIKDVEVIIGSSDRRNRIDSSTSGAGVFLNVNLGANQLITGGLPNGQVLQFQVVGFRDVIGSNEADTIIGDSANNSLSGLGGNDLIRSGAGNDLIDGGAGDDKLYGDEGNDRFMGSSGNDTIEGGLGHDTLDYSNLGKAITYRYAFPISPTSPPSGFTTEASNRILKDPLPTTNPADLGSGNLGTDTFSTIEVIRGATGQANAVDFSFTRFPVTRGISLPGGIAPAIEVDLGAKRLTIPSLSQTLTLENFRNVTGSFGNDRIVGDDQANTLNGFFGSDILVGGGGDDLLITEEGDTLTGGSGNDRFLFQGALVTRSGRSGVSFRAVTGSTITDFTPGADQLVLKTGFQFTGIPTGETEQTSYSGFQGLQAQVGTNTLNPSQFFILGSGDPAPSQGQGFVFYNSATGDLLYRAPQDGPLGNGLTKFATLQGAPMLKAQDIVLV